MVSVDPRQAPLRGISVLEMEAIGPVPHVGSMLVNLGASVTVVRAPNRKRSFEEWHAPYRVAKRLIELDLKSSAGSTSFRHLVSQSDVLIEGGRPGVMERLGAGPEVCHEFNPSLVYARVTGWGQTGPHHAAAGHDINYAAACGALFETTGSGRPVAPLNLLADFAGGAMHAAVSILAALAPGQHRRAGQTLDIAMVDGLAALLTMHHAMLTANCSNPLQAPAPYYDTYACQDGQYVAVGALEDVFFSRLMQIVDIDSLLVSRREDPAVWPDLRKALAAQFIQRTRDEWNQLGLEYDCCVSGVYSLEESAMTPQINHRIQLQRSEGTTGGASHPYLEKDPT